LEHHTAFEDLMRRCEAALGRLAWLYEHDPACREDYLTEQSPLTLRK
jgi:hypothetical protein